MTKARSGSRIRLTELLERVLKHHNVVNEIPATALHQYKLCDKLTRVLGESLAPNNRNGIWAPESPYEFPLCKEPLGALVLFAN